MLAAPTFPAEEEEVVETVPLHPDLPPSLLRFYAVRKASQIP
jgi:hypothetical protein